MSNQKTKVEPSQEWKDFAQGKSVAAALRFWPHGAPYAFDGLYIAFCGEFLSEEELPCRCSLCRAVVS